jgi:hypothetical protein
MTTTVLLFDPTGISLPTVQQVQHTLSGLAGKVVGFIDNSKPNFNHLVDDIADALIGKFGVSRVVKHHKRAASIPASTEIYEDLAGQCDLVITGSGD